jgi:serine/threonine protein kinase
MPRDAARCRDSVTHARVFRRNLRVVADTRIGKYRLIAEIGRGGMADVYLAVSAGPAGFRKLVVIKELRPSLAREREFRAMFLDEARLAARLQHPNVVQTYEVGSVGDGTLRRHFLAMEYLDGQPLHRLIKRVATGGTREGAHTLPLNVTLEIATAVLAGLHSAHELRDFDGTALGVVHRDVSPHNVFVTYDGQTKLVDFGIAKAVGARSETRAGVLKGKVAYMAPEQARGDQVDRRADLFAVGTVLWECIAGRRMWRGVPDLTIVHHLLNGEIPSLAEAAPDAPADVIAVVERALAPDRERRYQTALEMQEALERCLAAHGGAPGNRAIGALLDDLFADHREKTRAIINAQLESLGATDSDDEHAIDADLRLASLEDGDSTGSLRDDPSEHTSPSSPSAIKRDRTGSSTFAAQGNTATSNAPAPTPRWLPWVAVGLLGVGATAVAASRWVHGPAAPAASASALASSTPPARVGGGGPAPVDSAAAASACDAKEKPLVELSGEIDSDATLYCDRDYLLKFTTFVRHGATLTIQPGTTLRGDRDTKGTLVVQPGGRLMAVGTPERPIVFTSVQPEGRRAPGDWGGVMLLGRAPINLRDANGKPARGRVEGITHGGDYGGDDPDDDSGALSYVRIEYSGVAIAPNNEINGLTLAGVGRKTRIDHVQVRQTADDCFEFFGGTVDAKYLACQYNGDDGFDWDFGYAGRLQFLVLQQDPSVVDDTNGFEGDNDPNGSSNAPVSNPTIYNATLCGHGREVAKEQYGLLLRRGTHGKFANLVVMGFEAGLDVRDASTKFDLRSAVFFGNLVHNLAYPEKGGADGRDDDEGFDERAFLQDPSRKVFEHDPKIRACFDANHPVFGPAVSLTEGAAAPPDDGFFDPSAKWIGAFKDANDTWATAPWTVWRDR